MSLLEILLGAGIVSGLVVTGIAYRYCARRELAFHTRLGRALAVGGASFGGFLVPYVFSEQLRHQYFQVLKSRPIVVSPREWLAVSLAIGLGIAVVLVSLSLAGSRLRRRTHADRH